MFQYFQKKVAQVAKKKEAQIVQAQLSKEIMAEQNANVRELAVQRAKVAKQEEQELIVIQNKRVREAADLRKIEIEKEKVLIELEKEKVIQAKKEKALVLIAREREKVLEEAKLKGDKIKEQAKIAVQKKIKLEEEEEEQKVLIEIEKQKIRVFNARRAEVERQFTRVQLEALREQFDEADADNSDSIDANELMAVCRSLGENLSMKQVKALIAEVDDDGSGEIEWEEYLIIMGKKRKDAMKKGSGLFQKMSMRSDAASIKKDEQIRKRLKENEEKSKLAAIDREKKKNKADKRKAKEKKMILKKNQMKQAKGLEGAEQVEIAKKIAEAEKKKRVQEKELKARQVEKDIVKQKKMAVVQKKKEKEERARLAEIRRQDKEKYEESLRVIKEKIVTAKTAGKKQVVRLLTDKLKQMQDNNKTKNKKKLGGSIVPKRPATNNKKIGKGKGAKSNGRKVFNPAESSYA